MNGASTTADDNERLEFLGGRSRFALSDVLMKKFRNDPEVRFQRNAQAWE